MNRMPDYIKIYISNDKYGHHGNGKINQEEECDPCYCGWTGVDNDGCTCNLK
tara:strand:+ start:260 stop:415 length:156 start_codon:yes stop_codon:yes gene_type:complete